MDFSRRRFLIGGGGVLLLPFLPSIHLSAFAATPGEKKRFISFRLPHGMNVDHWYPQISRTKIADNSSGYILDLTKISGAVCDALNTPDLIGLKNKTLVVHGLDHIWTSFHSNQLFLSGVQLNKNGGEVYPTIDQLIGRKIYESAPTERVVNFYVGGGSPPDSKSTIDQNTRAVVNNDPNILYDKIFNLHLAGSTGSKPEDPRKKLVDKVFPEYKSLMGHKNLSSQDKIFLDAYISNLNDIQSKYSAKEVAACPAPVKGDFSFYKEDTKEIKGKESQKLLALDTYIDLTVAAIQCDMSRVFNIGFGGDIFGNNFGSSNTDYHTSISHNPNVPAHKNDILLFNKMAMDKLGGLCKRLDELIDPVTGKSLLDSTLAMAGHEIGDTARGETHENDNHCQSAHVNTFFGGLNGLINTGKFLEFKRDIEGVTWGRPYNELMIAIMQAYGLEEADYKQNGLPGYGMTGFFNLDGKSHKGKIGRNKAYHENPEFVVDRTRALPHFLKS